MSLKIDRLQLEIIINNDQARKSLRALDEEARLINKELKGLTQGTQEWIQKSERLKSIKQQMDSIYEKIGLTGLSLKELTARQKELNMILLNMDPRLPQFKQYQEQLKAVGTRITELRGKAAQSGLSFSGLADSLNRYQTMIMAGTAALTGMVLAIKGLLSAQGDLADSFADIRRTTGMTADEVLKLNAAFKKLDTRTANKDLRGMAVVAGQLGIEKDKVLDFVSAIDKLNVSLGMEIGGGAEGVAKEVGTLRNVLTDMKSSNISDDLLRIGNAINELGMAGFATSPVIIDFANRIGGVGIALGLTSDEVLGISATLQELNVSTERGGTAISKLLQRMTTHVTEFATIAGMPVKEFADLINRDLYGAFVKMLEGTKRGGQSATLLGNIIKDLEVQGAGASEVISKLGRNTEMMSEKVKLAGDSLQNTDGIMNSFKVKNENLAGEMAKLNKAFYSLITMPSVNNFFASVVSGLASMVAFFKDLPGWIEKNRLVLISLTGATLAWVAAGTRSLQVAIWNNLTMQSGILLKIKDSVVMTVLIAKEELLTIWKAKGTIASKLAATAQLAWNATLAANPVGAVVLGITALVVAIKAYDKYNAQAVQNEMLKESTLKRLATINSFLADQYAKLNEQIRNLNKLSAQEKIDLQEKIEKNIKLAETELTLMLARQKDIGSRNAYATVWQEFWNSIKSGGNAGVAAVYSAVDAAENGIEAASKFDESISTLRTNLKQLKDSNYQLSEITKAESYGDLITGKTYEQLAEKLSKYQTALRNTTAGSAEYLRIQGKIKETNKDLAKFQNDETDKGEKKLTALKKLNKEIQDYIDLLQQQVDTDPAQAKLTADKIKRLQDQKKHIEDLCDSLLKATTREESFNEAWERMTGERADQREETPDEQFDRLSGGAFGGEDVQEDPDMAWERMTGEKIQKEGEDPLWKGKSDAVLSYAETVQSTFASLDQFLSAAEDASLRKDEYNNEQKKNNLKKQLDNKKITQAQYNIAVEKLDLDLAKKQRKIAHDQAVRQKELSIINATINTLVGATKAWVDPGGTAGIVLAILIGVLGALSIGLIASTPVPAAAKGRYKAAQAALGIYNVTGAEDGKLYENVPYVSSFTGIPGKPLLVNETGDEIVIDPYRTKNMKMNYPGLIDAIMRVPQRATGQYPSSINNQPSSSGQMATDPEYLAAIKEHTLAMQKPVQAVIVYDNFIIEQKKINRIDLDTSKS